MKKKLISSVFMLSFVLILAACNFTGESKSTSSESEGSENKSETVAQSSEQALSIVAADEIASLDPAVAHDSISNTAIFTILEGLYSLGKDSIPVLTGATNHEISEDGLVHTFTLRENTWSNGTPVTAHDYEYSWKRMFEKQGYYMYIFSDSNILNAQEIMDGTKNPDELGVKAVDDHTLEVTLSNPFPLLAQQLAYTPFMPLNKEYVESVGEKFGAEFDTVIANGPFVMTDWKHEQGWEYKKNESYWDASTVKLEKIKVNVVKEESTAVNLYEAGEVDLIEITSANVDKYRENEGYNTIDSAGLRFLRFNHNHEVLSNENIRRAFDLAWDKQGLVDVILKNGSTPTYYLVPEVAKMSTGESFRDLNGDFKGTIEEAQDYWKQGLEELGIDNVEINLLTADDSEYRSTAEYLQSQWESNLEGLKVNIFVQPFQQRVELEKAVDYDISISSVGVSLIDPSKYLNMFTTDSSFNRMGYSNPKYDELMEKAMVEIDEKTRFELMAEAEKLAFDEAVFGPMYQNSVAIVQQSYVKDVVYNPVSPQFVYKWAYIEGK